MGQIKNIKLHIVTDIKHTAHTIPHLNKMVALKEKNQLEGSVKKVKKIKTKKIEEPEVVKTEEPKKKKKKTPKAPPPPPPPAESSSEESSDEEEAPAVKAPTNGTKTAPEKPV